MQWAAALGLGGVTGRIQKNHRADLILIDLNRPHLAPMYDPYAHLVYSAGRDDVRSVIIDGTFVMRDRKLLTIDERAVLADTKCLAIEIERHAAVLSHT